MSKNDEKSKPKWGDSVQVPFSAINNDPEVTFYFSPDTKKNSDIDIIIDNIFDYLRIDKCEPKKISYCWIRIVEGELGTSIRIPIMVAKGAKPGPILGLTAALHGNELQGIPAIHTVFRELKPKLHNLQGVVVGVPCLNVPGYIRRQRGYSDGVDLNRSMPGSEFGTSSQQYCFHLFNKIINKFNFLIDLHTASNGRINSFYVRADMRNSTVKDMATSFQSNIIVHNSTTVTLRGAAMEIGIPTICVEVGNPLTFDDIFIKKAINGIFNVMNTLNLLKKEIILPDDLKIELPNPIICYRSYWIYTQHGGLITVHPKLGEHVKKNQIIASVVNIFGIITAEYRSPEDGIIVGKAENPTAQQGDRIVHLGIPLTPKQNEINFNGYFNDADD